MAPLLDVLLSSSFSFSSNAFDDIRDEWRFFRVDDYSASAVSALPPSPPATKRSASLKLNAADERRTGIDEDPAYEFVDVDLETAAFRELSFFKIIGGGSELSDD